MAERKPVYIRCPRCELNYCLKKEKICSVCKAELEGDRDMYINELDLELCPICKTNYIQPEEIMCASCLKERQAQGKDIDDDEWSAYLTRDDDDDYIDDDEETGDMASISDLDDDVLSDDLVDDLDFGFDSSMLDDEDFEDDDEEENNNEDDFEDLDEEEEY